MGLTEPTIASGISCGLSFFFIIGIHSFVQHVFPKHKLHARHWQDALRFREEYAQSKVSVPYTPQTEERQGKVLPPALARAGHVITHGCRHEEGNAAEVTPPHFCPIPTLTLGASFIITSLIAREEGTARLSGAPLLVSRTPWWSKEKDNRNISSLPESSKCSILQPEKHESP